MVPQQWLAHTTANGVDARERRRLDLVIYGVSPRGEALCCATLVSPLTRSGAPQPRASEEDGAALRVAERRKRATYPELLAQGPQRLLVLGSEVGGRWNDEALGLVRDLARCRSLRAPPAVRRAAAAQPLGARRHSLTIIWVLDSWGLDLGVFGYLELSRMISTYLEDVGQVESNLHVWDLFLHFLLFV